MATSTSNFNFYILEYGDTGWHNLLNTNFQKIDTHFKRFRNNVAGNLFISGNAFLIYDKGQDLFKPLIIPSEGKGFIVFQSSEASTLTIPQADSLILAKDGDIVFDTKVAHDIEFTDSQKGVILVDRSDNSKKYRLYIEGGQLLVEPVE